jgi:sugar phosphate isomerase/epimerase
MRNLADHLNMCSVNTATLGFQAPIAEVIEAVARHGFGGIAPWRREIEGQDVSGIAKKIRDAGLKVTGFCRSTYIPGATRDAFLASIDDNKRAISTAAKLGSDVFVLVVGSLKDIAAARRMVVEGLGLLLDHAASEGVKLALEPLHPVYAADRSCITTTAQALDICDQLEPSGMKQLGVLLDVYHIWWDPDVQRQIKRAGQGSRILGFHVNDWLLETKDPLNDRGMMGDGVIDLQGLRRAVEQAGYRGFVEVEIFSQADWWKRSMNETLETVRARMVSVT